MEDISKHHADASLLDLVLMVRQQNHRLLESVASLRLAHEASFAIVDTHRQLIMNHKIITSVIDLYTDEMAPRDLQNEEDARVLHNLCQELLILEMQLTKDFPITANAA